MDEWISIEQIVEDGRECDLCGGLFTEQEWDSRHDEHEPDCPNYGQEDNDEHIWFTCDCDLVYHDKCCPSCNSKEVQK